MANGEISGPPAVDFYGMLSGLGNTIHKGMLERAAQQKEQAGLAAFSQLDPNAPNYMAAAQSAFQSGNMEAGQKLLSLKIADDERKHTLAREGVTDSRWAQDFALRKAAAARADDPTPDNFVADKSAPGGYRPIGPADPAYIESVTAAKARAAALVPPDGFTRQQDGTLAPLPGGPQDPEYQAKLDAAKARARGDVPTIIGPGSSVIVPNKAGEGPVFTNKLATGGGLSQNALDIRAAQWNNGDYEGATKNVGRGAQGGATLEAIANRAAERLVDQGYSVEAAAAITSSNMQKFRAAGIGQNTESRTGASREANLKIILKATDAAIPAALEQSEKISRTGFVPLNRLIQKGQVMTSDPELRKFAIANLQLAEHWARAMNPTGVMRESDRDLALHNLQMADTKETYQAAVAQIKKQIDNELKAVSSTHAPVSERFDASGGNTAGATAAQAALKAKYGLD